MLYRQIVLPELEHTYQDLRLAPEDADLLIAGELVYAAPLVTEKSGSPWVSLPILVRLLTDPAINYVIPWSLGQVGSRSAIAPLIETTSDPDPSIRVLAIHALVELRATEALPRLRELAGDSARPDFDRLESVAEAAQAASRMLQPWAVH